MSTIVEVARRAGVSIGTVSNVIRGTARVSPERRRRVTEAIHELGYYPGRIADHLKIRQSSMLGMVLPDITNPFFPEIMRGAEDRAFERGYLLVTANTDEQPEREEQIVSVLRSRRIDGILLAASSGRRNGHIRAAIQAGISVVCIDRPAAGIRTDAVLLDNADASRKCIKHLIDAGYRRIAIVTGPLGVVSARERLQGYKDALTAEGIRPGTVFEGDYRRESGYRLGKKLARMRRRPDAVFVCNAVMAQGALEALEEEGLESPFDIALATVDDLPGEHALHRRVTAVVQPSYEIGSRAATLLMDRVEGRRTGPPVVVRVTPELRKGEYGSRRGRKADWQD